MVLGDPTSPGVRSVSGDECGSSTEKDDTDSELLGTESFRPGTSKDEQEIDGDFQFQHLDLVWASCADYPCPFPGVIIDPRAPTSAYGSAAAFTKPPENILRKQNLSEFRYLVMIFGENNSW